MVESDGIDETSRAAPRRRGRRRVVTVAVVLAAAAGAGVGATALASAATAPSTTQPASGESPSTSTPGPEQGPGGRIGGHFGGGGFGGFGGFGGPVVHGQYTVKGPNGYETIDERTGTVSAVTNTSGSTWSLTVKSADGTSGTFVVNSSSSVNGGESGIASVKSGDTVVVTATDSGGTATATQITDQTTLQANGKSWLPRRGQAPTGGAAPSTPSTDGASGPGGFPGTDTAPSAT